ncbi:YceI family protein [Paraflavitalea pollutisoli]|uniref:YceI family protein n=1 Tax=Paraflavitalea pollutisoli TaxID=3034143 RepID=UPI0023EA9FF1|nr:YceI family protein [Paraflavitalea sp. H1-2-19X]
MRKQIVGWLVAMIVTGAAFGQTYLPVADSSSITFTIKNLGVPVKGSFSALAGTIRFDPEHPETSHFDVQVGVASINTGNKKRDEHLRDAAFFDVQNYPVISFVSKKVTAGKKAGTFFIEGTLTIRSISLPLSIAFTAVPTSDGFLMEGAFDTRRKPYGVGKTSTISDKLQVQLRVLVRQAAQDSETD